MGSSGSRLTLNSPHLIHNTTTTATQIRSNHLTGNQASLESFALLSEKMTDSKYFTTTNKGEIFELKSELNSDKKERKSEAVKKVNYDCL